MSPNPWLSIPASDYEGHMASPVVGQTQFLSAVFGEILEEVRPAALAVLGCATGNGFERVDRTRTRRAVGVDINPEYLEIARRRFPGLELARADLTVDDLPPGPFDLIHAALILEYAAPRIIVPKAVARLGPGGVFSAVIQLAGGPRVSRTGYESLSALEPFMALVDPDELRALALRYDLAEVRTRTHTLASGKAFGVAVWRMKEQ
jgi:SAM-dependent methyltransferase